MKKLHYLTLLFFSAIVTLNAQWTQVPNTPVYVVGTQFTSVGSTIVQLTNNNGTLQSSTDNGVNWSTIPKPDSLIIYKITSYTGTLYALGYVPGPGTKYLLKTTNNGSNWSVIPIPPYSNNGPQDVVVNSNGIYLTYETGTIATRGLWFSSNNGVNWSHLTGNFEGEVLTVSGNNIFCGTYYNGIWRSTDGGVNWTQVYPSNTANAIRILPSGTVLSTFNYSNIVFRSTDLGSSWQQINLGFQPIGIFLSGSTAYVASENGIFKSTDDGTTWSQFALQGIKTYDGYISGSIFLANTSWGTYRSSNSGVNWTRLYQPLTPYITSLAVISNTMYAGTYSGLFVSSNSGTNWTHLGPDSWRIKAIETAGPNIIVSVDSLLPSGSYTSNGLYISSNNGVTWTKTLSLPTDFLEEIRNFGSFVLTGGSFTGSFRSTNNGLNWSPIPISGVRSFATTGSVLFAGGTGGTYRSTNNGNNWITVMGIQSLAVGGNSSYVFTAINTPALYRSSNNGITWFPTGFYIPISEIYVDNSNVVVGSATPGIGIYFSSDNGVNWFDRNDGFPPTYPGIYRILVSGTYMYAVTDNGIWKRPYSEIISGAKSISNVVPKEYQLYQNYPNPFNPKTKIKFDIVKTGNVKLEVYDIRGALVKTLINSTLQSGTYETELDATALAGGIYFYRLIANGFEKTNKMMLIK
ncbi:MAG: T9SS type A sorting domain-containing protein [Ignavibacteria bacterium]